MKGRQIEGKINEIKLEKIFETKLSRSLVMGDWVFFFHSWDSATISWPTIDFFWAW